MTETKSNLSLRPYLAPVGKLFNKIIPPYDQRLDLDEKLVKGEKTMDEAVVRHFSEVQILIAVITIPLGFFLVSQVGSGYGYMVTVLGLLLFFTAYEMEEIVITTHRIMIRRIGLIERILKIPSDEEHGLSHVVSLQVGRAPVNVILLIISIPGFFALFEEVPDLLQLLVVISSTVILIFGLRINRRAVTLHLAGGFSIIMGVRKGVPKRIISSIQKSIYESRPVLLDQSEEIPEEVLAIASDQASVGEGEKAKDLGKSQKQKDPDYDEEAAKGDDM